MVTAALLTHLHAHPQATMTAADPTEAATGRSHQYSRAVFYVGNMGVWMVVCVSAVGILLMGATRQAQEASHHIIIIQGCSQHVSV